MNWKPGSDFFILIFLFLSSLTIDAQPVKSSETGKNEHAITYKKITDTSFSRGDHIILPGIGFELGKSTFSPEANDTLQLIFNFLCKNSSLCFEIGNHTDTRGDPLTNLKLSEERAKAVYDYFMRVKKIDAGRLSYAGYGSTKLLYKINPGSTAPWDQFKPKSNRRTEFIVLSRKYPCKNSEFTDTSADYRRCPLRDLIIPFVPGNSTFNTGAMDSLALILSFLRIHPDVVVQIRCHVDSPSENNQLAFARAKAVFGYLNSTGHIGADRIVPWRNEVPDSPAYEDKRFLEIVEKEKERRMKDRTEIRVLRIIGRY